jgi:hypothetical protein
MCFIFGWTNLDERVDTYQTAESRIKHEIHVTFRVAKLMQLTTLVIAETEMLLVQNLARGDEFMFISLPILTTWMSFMNFNFVVLLRILRYKNSVTAELYMNLCPSDDPLVQPIINSIPKPTLKIGINLCRS